MSSVGSLRTAVSEVYNFVNVSLAFGRNEARKAPKDDTMRAEEDSVVFVSFTEKAQI